MRTRGLTLIEVLLSLAIIVIVMGLFVGILATSAKVQLRQSALSEVTNQANFVMQTIQRLVRESSAAFVNCEENEPVQDNDKIDVGSFCEGDPGDTLIGAPQRFLRLRMPDEPRDPTIIWAEDSDSNPNTPDEIKIQEGATAERTIFTTDKVNCDADESIANHCLTFTKFTNYPGRDHVEINLTLTAAANPGIARELITSVSRASAATFDSPVSPGSGQLFDLGNSGNPWNKLYVNEISGQFSEPENYDGGTRGHKIIGYINVGVTGYTAPNQTCNNICSAHGLVCSTVSQRLYPTSQSTLCGDVFPADTAGFCFCN